MMQVSNPIKNFLRVHRLELEIKVDDTAIFNYKGDLGTTGDKNFQVAIYLPHGRCVIHIAGARN